MGFSFFLDVQLPFLAFALYTFKPISSLYGLLNDLEGFVSFLIQASDSVFNDLLLLINLLSNMSFVLNGTAI